jgi:hypothetical protein
MRNYDDLREMLCNELSDLYNETMKKGGASAAELDAIRDITSSIKNIYKIEMFEDEEYSHGGDWQADMRGTYGRGSSYARRGTHYVRGHYSRADSMEHLREQINDMMRETDDDRVKEALRRAASLMEE